MKCLACDQQIVCKSIKGCQVEVCPSCEGIWANSKVLRDLFHLDVGAGRILQCPRCGIALSKEYSGNVEVDVCPKCLMIWLDKSELAKLWFSRRPSRQR